MSNTEKEEKGKKKGKKKGKGIEGESPEVKEQGITPPPGTPPPDKDPDD